MPRQRQLGIIRLAVRKTPLSKTPLSKTTGQFTATKNDHFTKTGSGQRSQTLFEKQNEVFCCFLQDLATGHDAAVGYATRDVHLQHTVTTTATTSTARSTKACVSHWRWW
jgi:hypothetical protein